jgi:SagB-type dehydrogenase family enzyme
MGNDMKDTIGHDFISHSSLSRSTIKEFTRLGGKSSPPFKEYSSAPKIELPRTSWRLFEARIQPLLQQRRSIRKYGSEPVQLIDLAFMLWACQGVTAKAGKHLLRTSPSAGALYPVETYLSVQNVEGLAAGLYHFNPSSFELALLAEGNQGKRLSAACLDQIFIRQAALCFIWSGVPRRSMVKYGERGMRYILMDVAHICQSALLAAEAVNCGGCPIAAFYDDEMGEFLGLDGIEEIPLYAASIGIKF